MLQRIPLYHRIALGITGLAIAAAVGLLVLASWSSNHYHQEVTQQLHKDMARYVLEHQPEPLLDDQMQINQQALKSIALNTMMINPMVEVYLLDPQGRILGHALPEAEIAMQKIDPAPVRAFVSGNLRGPLLGDNPRQPGRYSIFSAAAIVDTTMSGSVLKGYLYILLASHQAASIASQLADSHILRVTLGGLIALVGLFALISWMGFHTITQPLRQLTQRVRTYRLSRLNPDPAPVDLNEVAELEVSFEFMQKRIQDQFDQLQQADQLHRELIANVSHDLRTPLASMQGYLETLLLKLEQLTPEKRRHYLSVAHRHSQHMGKLVGQLFELSRLDAGRIEAKTEVFSLTELLFDIRQEYELVADKKGIAINMDESLPNLMVKADIGLIHRVLQNLLDNAVRHTPQGGGINLQLRAVGQKVQVSLSDNGEGIAAKDLPFLFERYYQSSEHKGRSTIGSAGLGLSIVKRILELHGATIQVHSAPAAGTSFSFALPMPG